MSHAVVMKLDKCRSYFCQFSKTSSSCALMTDATDTKKVVTFGGIYGFGIESWNTNNETGEVLMDVLPPGQSFRDCCVTVV